MIKAVANQWHLGQRSALRLAAAAPQDRFTASAAADQPAPVSLKDMLRLTASAQSETVRPVTDTAAVRLPGLDKVWAQGFTGKGQTVAIIDSGIFPHPDLKDRIVGWVDFANHKSKPVDTYGHGTHVAGIVAGSGKKSDGKVKGVAPDANLVGLRIGSVQDAIAAIDWCIENKEQYNLGVINLSLGDRARVPAQQDPWCQAVQRAIDAGLTVVVAAGNEGESGLHSIATPGISPNAITVGGLDDQGTADPGDDVMYTESSLGPTVDGLQKPDVMAPAIAIYSTLSPGSARDDRMKPHVGNDYMTMVGTSQATPAVAGLVALLRQARPDLTPADYKQILMQSVYHGQQNLPIVQADAALKLAQSWPARAAA